MVICDCIEWDIKLIGGENMNNQIFIGIDPGATGAIAFIDSDNHVDIFDFDDGEAMLRLKKLWRMDMMMMAVIEKVGAMPKQGVVSTFKFGVNFGQWIGRLEALDVPFDFVTPQKWKKAMFDSMPKYDPKEMSRDRAWRLFPQAAELLKRKKDHNRAEALLLAEYARVTDK